MPSVTTQFPLGKMPRYEELVPKARLTQLNARQKCLLAALVAGLVVCLGVSIGNAPWSVRLLAVGGTIAAIAAWIKLFESPCLIRVYDTELTFEQETVFTSIKKEGIQFFTEAFLIMPTRGASAYHNHRTPHAIFLRGAKEKRVQCEVMPYYIPFFLPTMSAKGVLVVTTNRKYPTFIPTTRPAELLAALNKLTNP